MAGTQSQTHAMPHAFERIRQAVHRAPSARLTALYHHVYDPGHLREAYLALKRNAAPGVDAVTWKQYGQELDRNLSDLSARLRRGAYRAKPVRRTYIAKADGRQRPLGVTALEDKVVQRVATGILNAIFEPAFLGFSYGFRPKRNQHNALDALWVGLTAKKVNWVLDADVSGFFDNLTHSWLLQFLEHRITDQHFLRLARKWLNAGVLEGGEWRRQEEGTPQGAIVSPVLANVYLHFVLDLWAQQWRRRHAKGDVIIVRYADDFVAGFQHREDAERFQKDLAERFAKFDLELHPEKTRLIRFGRYAAEQRAERGEGRPETFSFLGFTHVCGKTRRGKFVVLRRTKRKRMLAKLQELHLELKRRLHEPIPKVGAWLKSVLIGHFRYYGVPMNAPAMCVFRMRLMRLWWQVLRRRSQRTRITWNRMYRLSASWLPQARIQHPWPDQRLHVTTRGKSRMR